MERTKPTIKWLYLSIGSVAYLMLGVLFSWSVIKVPLRENLGFSLQQLAVCYTVSLCFFCAGNMITGALLKRLGSGVLLTLGALFVLLGFAGVSFLESGWTPRLIFSYGVLVGCGVGISYNAILSTVTAWFPGQRGLSSGLLMMCFGISSVFWGKLSPKLFSAPWPGWRGAYLMMALSISVSVLLCAALLRRPAAAEPPSEKAPSEKAAAENEYTCRQVMRSHGFWTYYLHGICAAAVGSTVFSFALDVSLSLGATASLAGSLVGLASVGNGLGRILCGLSVDAVGVRRTVFLACCVTVLAPLLMLFAIPTHSLILAAVSLLLSGLSFGTCPTIGSTLISSFYGTKYFPANYSLSNSKMIFSSLGATVAGALLNRSGSYFPPYVMLLLLSLISFGLSFLIQPPTASASKQKVR